MTFWNVSTVWHQSFTTWSHKTELEVGMSDDRGVASNLILRYTVTIYTYLYVPND